MEFRRAERSYFITPAGWRLATYEEARKGLKTIEQKNVLEKWDRARLLDGWITGPGYNFQMGNNFRGCLGYMLLIQTEARISGSVYDGLILSDSGKEVALFLCVEDWNLELVYWLLNSWVKKEAMSIKDVIEGSIPFRDVKTFKEMNRMVGYLARKIGDQGPIDSMEAEERKYSGPYSARDLLRERITNLKNDPNITENQIYSKFHASLPNCFPRSLVSQWLADVVNEGGEAWKAVANVFWNFLYDNYAEHFMERFLTDSCLAYIYSENSKFDRNTMSTSQMNFICATSILLYLSYYRCNIVHAAIPHGYRNYCAECIIALAANEAAILGKDAAGCFNQILGNNALWRYYESTGNYGILNKLLVCATRGIDPYVVVPDQQTDLLMINRLLECGAQPTTWIKLTRHKYKRALDYAVKWKNEDLGIQCAKCLLDGSHGQQRDELVRASDEKGRTTLHRASSAGNSRICQLLLHYGATIDAQDEKGKTALHLAVEKSKEKVINVFGEDELIANCVDLKDKWGHSPLDALLSSIDAGISIGTVVKLFLKSKQPEAYLRNLPTETREHLLREILVKGHADAVEKLSSHVAKLPGALNFAAMCDVEGTAWKMIIPILRENQENMEELVRSDKKGRTVLHEAALRGHESLCKYLMEINSKLITIQDVNGRNALYDAVKGKRSEAAILKELVPALLERDIVLDDLIDRSGETPLHVAASLGKTEVVKALLFFSKNPENYVKKSDFLGKTALHNAAYYGDSDTVNILLQKGSKPLKERDCDGRTALHYCVQSKTEQDKISLVNCLLEGCETDEEKLLFLWASAVGLGTADHNLRSSDPLHKFLVEKKTEMGTGNLLKTAAKVGDIDMTKELITRGYQVGDVNDPEWRETLKPAEQEKVDSVSRQLSKIAEQGNDQPTISDNLGRIDYAQGLVALFLNPYIKPPITVGISGPWGMGKSSLMVQTESILLKTAAQIALLPSSKLPTSALELPDVKTFELSKKGKKKYGEVKRYVDHQVSKKGKKDHGEIRKPIDNEHKGKRSLFSTVTDKIVSCLKKRKTNEAREEIAQADQDSLSDFLRDYKIEYRKIFKLLAAMNSSDMFTTRAKEDSKHQQSPLKAIWNMLTRRSSESQEHQHSRSKNIWHMLSRKGQRSKVDYPSEENVPAVLTVQYNAWRYRNEIEALAGLAVDITKELEGIMTQAQWLSTCWRNTWNKRKYNIWIEIIYPCLLAVVLACTFTWIIWITLDRYKFKDWAKTKYACLPAAIVIIGWTMTKSVMGILKPVSTQLMNYISFPDHTDKLGYQERVISDINFLKDEIGKDPYIVFTIYSWILFAIARLWLPISKWLIASLFFHPIFPTKTMLFPNVAPSSGAHLRIIVFIDDLDRCQELVILQVLSAINLVLAVCEISVVLGIDKELIEKAVIKKHGDMSNRSSKNNKDLADKYLQKIIQLPLDLPEPSEEQSRMFLGQLGVLQVRKGSDSEMKENSQMSKISSLKTSMPVTDARRPTELSLGDTMRRETGGDPEIAIEMEATTSDPAPVESDAEPVESEAATSLSDQRGIEQQAENRTSNRNSSAIWIREMLFVRYSQGEQDAFSCFLKMATNSRKLPREWKRLITYHRLVWNILYLTREAKDLDGWQVQLITWIFICWEWQENMNFVIEKWNNIPDLKTSESKGPSLQMIVDHFIEHELEEKKETIPQDSDSKNTNTLIESSNGEQEKSEDAGQREGEMKKQKEEEEQVATETLGNAVKEQLADVLEKTVRKELDELKKEVNDLKDLVMKQFCMKNNEKETGIKLQKDLKGQITKHGRKHENREEEKRMKLEWKRLRSVLRRYNVSMEGILAFQRFRFYCKARHLSWPLPQQENEELGSCAK